jgi:hypothetical protein
MTEKELEKLEKGNLKHQQSHLPRMLPMFQPSAAAAMMYSNQNDNRQRDINNIEPLGKNDSSVTNNSYNSNSDSKFKNEDRISIKMINEEDIDEGRICSSVIAQTLKKQPNRPSKKAYRFLPYVCLRCKKETFFCDTAVQTLEKNGQEEENDDIYGVNNFIEPNQYHTFYDEYSINEKKRLDSDSNWQDFNVVTVNSEVKTIFYLV